jgi:hypothetical protein
MEIFNAKNWQKENTAHRKRCNLYFQLSLSHFFLFGTYFSYCIVPLCIGCIFLSSNAIGEILTFFIVALMHPDNVESILFHFDFLSNEHILEIQIISGVRMKSVANRRPLLAKHNRQLSIHHLAT